MDNTEKIQETAKPEEKTSKSAAATAVAEEVETTGTIEPTKAAESTEVKESEQFTEKQLEERTSARRLEYNGDRLFDNKRYEEASGYFERALVIYKKINDLESIARVAFNIGYSMEQIQKYEEAIEKYLVAKETYKKLGKMDDYAVTADRTAKTYYWQGKSKDAIREYEEAADEGVTASEIHNNMGFIYLEFREYEKAKSTLTKALEFRKNEESQDIHVTYNNLGISHFLTGEYKEAEKYFREGLEADKKSNSEDRSVQYMIFAKPEFKGEKFEEIRVFYNVNTRACIMGNLASTLAMQDKYDEALSLIEKAMDIDREQAYIREAAGWIHIKKGDDMKAVELFKRALSYDTGNEDIRKVVQLINPYLDAKAGRNDPCPCGSGKKFKKCHGGI
jgi:tetratricopeptide (TPR) repeat protein